MLYARAAAKKVSAPTSRAKQAKKNELSDASKKTKARVRDARARIYSSENAASGTPETTSHRSKSGAKVKKYRIPGSNFMERMEVRLKSQQLVERHRTLQKQIQRLQKTKTARQSQKERDAARSAGKPGWHANLNVAGVYWGREGSRVKDSKPVRPKSAHYSPYTGTTATSSAPLASKRPNSAVPLKKKNISHKYSSSNVISTRLEVAASKAGESKRSGAEISTSGDVRTEVVAGSGVMAVRSRIGKSSQGSSHELRSFTTEERSTSTKASDTPVLATPAKATEKLQNTYNSRKHPHERGKARASLLGSCG